MQAWIKKVKPCHTAVPYTGFGVTRLNAGRSRQLTIWGVRHRAQQTPCNHRHLRFSGVACVTATVATDLAAPDGHKRSRIAVGTAPGQDIPIGGLHDGEYMSGALIGHVDAVFHQVSTRCVWWTGPPWWQVSGHLLVEWIRGFEPSRGG